MNSKTIVTLSWITGLALLLAGCGNTQSANGGVTNNSSKPRTSLINYKLAAQSSSLDANTLSPNQVGALVLYYAGAENNQNYVKRLKDNHSQLAIDLYNANNQPASTGVKKSLPSGSQVLYYVSLGNSGATYYTIVNDQFYIADGHGGFKTTPVTKEAMVDLANKNNAGNVINNLAKASQLNDKRNGNSSDSGKDSQGSMTFDEAAALIQKGGFTDFNYDSAQSFHDGSHATGDGYVMVTYPGAKGKDVFTITKTGKNKYHIEAQYLGGSSDGYVPLEGDYGPTSADVTK